MIKEHFINRVVELTKVPEAHVAQVITAIQSVVAQELADSGESRLPGIVLLKVLARSERAARNPKTGVACMVAPGHTVKSRPSSSLTQLVIKNIEASPINF